jgi:hypothetical protein
MPSTQPPHADAPRSADELIRSVSQSATIVADPVSPNSPEVRAALEAYPEHVRHLQLRMLRLRTAACPNCLGEVSFTTRTEVGCHACGWSDEMLKAQWTEAGYDAEEVGRSFLEVYDALRQDRDIHPPIVWGRPALLGVITICYVLMMLALIFSFWILLIGH